MMSQVSFQDPSWVSIPFEKYSHNTSRTGTRKYTWSHIGPGKNLKFDMHNFRGVDEHGNYTTRVIMKILSGTEVLEIQDLGELVACYRQFDPSGGLETPVQVVVRPPFWIAMVYPKTAMDVHRTQFKFFNDEDFRRVVAVIKDLGLPTKESLPSRDGVVSIPPSSSSPAIFSVGSASTSFSAASSVSRPTSAMQAAMHPTGGDLARQLSLGFKIPQIPRSTSSLMQHPSSALPCSIPQSPHPLPPPGITPALAGPTFAQDPAKQSSFYLSQMEKQSQAQQIDQSAYLGQNLGRNDFAQNPPLLAGRILPHREEGLQRGATARHNTTSPYFSFQDEKQLTGHVLSDSESALGRLRHNDTPVSTSFNIPRPISGQSEYGALQSHWIPPRRELPFDKPQPIAKPRSSSAADLPPLPKPTPVARNESVIRPVKLPPRSISTTAAQPKKRVAQRKVAVAKVIEETPSPEAQPAKAGLKEIVLEAGQSMPEEPSPLAAKNAAATRPASAGSILQSKATVPSKKRATTRPAPASKKPKMVDQSTQTKTLSGRDHTTAMSAILKETMPELTMDALSPSSPPEKYLDRLDSFVTKYMARPAPLELWETPGYSTANDDERDSMLNDFVCENLENSDFLQLCNDTEHAWRRIGLGM